MIRKPFFRSILLAALLAAPWLAVPAAHVARESIEWLDLWITGGAGTPLPRVLLIGDSITRGYSSAVDALLKDKAAVSRLATSKSVGDPVLLEEIKLVLTQYRFDVIHFNNGLHGWNYSEEEYRAHFPELLATLRQYAPDAKLIWATITPVRDKANKTKLDPKTGRIKERNRIAAAAIAGQGIATDDLFGLVVDHPEYWGGDGVHFNPKGIQAAAGQVARAVQEQLDGIKGKRER